MWTSRLGHWLRREVFNSNARTRRTRTRASSTRWLPRCGPPAVLPRGRVLANRQRRCFKARLHVAGSGGRRAGAPRPKAHGLPKNRLETLIDGVFAIAMTILVLELRAPATLGPEGLGGSLGRAVVSIRDILHQFHRPRGLLVRQPPGLPLRVAREPHPGVAERSVPHGHRPHPVRRLPDGHISPRPDCLEPLRRGPRSAGCPRLCDLVVPDRRSGPD